MTVVLLIVVAICFYFVFDNARYFWKKYQVSRRLLEDKLDSQIFIAMMFFLILGIAITLEILF